MSRFFVHIFALYVGVGVHKRISDGRGLFRKGVVRFSTIMAKRAQQRYSSYRAILVAIVSQNSFVKLSAKGGGYRTILGGC